MFEYILNIYDLVVFCFNFFCNLFFLEYGIVLYEGMK